ncbi:hypothetical protein E8E13_009069 [Curvularia kusanoi]|uniref:DUF7492 domain-containing protein n=1 Tax=Curvularia kusanoi TaxID=90978 RepID=A0A9P4TF17_CURKU|nr:hypothetical protein E8E13_009069 [Curvularia kusanoi]
MPSFLATALAALAIAPLTQGHSWIEQLRNVNSKGEYVGEYGYPRGMVGRNDPGFNGDSMNWLLPIQPELFIDNTSPLCHKSQTKQKQSSDKYPRLQAAPGGFVAMRYQENGHVTLVDPKTGLGKPEKGGTVFIYGTTSPKEDEKLVDVLHWNRNSTGGDKRGTLLAMNNFDDDRCYEINPTAISKDRQVNDPNFALGQAVAGEPGNYPLFCESNVAVPKTAPEGKPYTFYWVWQWNTAPGTDPDLPKGKDQYYTTCIDVDVTSADKATAQSADTKFDLGPQQDAMSVAVQDFDSRKALITNALEGEVGPIFTGSATSGASKPTGAPAGNSSAIATPTAPALTQITNIPKPSGSATATVSGGAAVTVTDIVYVTVTAGASSKPAVTATASASASAVTSSAVTFSTVIKSSSAAVASSATPSAASPSSAATSAASSASASPSAAPAPSAGAPSGGLGGFNFPTPSAAMALTPPKRRSLTNKHGAKFRGI